MMKSIRLATLAMATSAMAATAQSTITIAPQPSRSIGLMDGPPAYLFQFIVGGTFIGNGNIVVGDRGTRSVRVFDAGGKLVAESGGEGGGPAEFQYIDRLWTHGDTVLVHDPRAAKIVRFDARGGFISSTPFPVGMARHLGNAPGGRVWLTRMTGTVAATPHGLTHDAHEVQLHRGGREMATISGFTGLWRLNGSPYPFTPEFRAAVVRDSLIVLDPIAARLRVYGMDGAYRRDIAVPAPRLAFRDAKRALEAELESREIRNAPPDLLQRARELPEVGELPRLSHMFADDRGRVWIKQYDPAEDAHWLGGWAGPEGGTWWIVEIATGRVSRTRMPDNVFPLAVAGGRLLGRHTDEYGVQRVVIHRVTET